ncbi:MAG TPA: glycosyltransferase family 2 protein [Nitrospiraceae bacterium]|nr:glycosyltransferase family 2 protein [Nitrospiraceae bacterium]
MMPSSPKCSVVIASYNYERYLPQAIESALGQDYPNVEVVVVDDGSTDGSPRVLERYAHRITAVRKANGGEASSRNVGFEHSTGDVVIFLDSDDYLFPDAASRIIEKFEPGVAKVHYPLVVVDAEGQSTGQIMADRLPSGDMGPLLRKFGFYPSPPTSGNAYSRAALNRIMPMPECVFARRSDTYEIIMSALHGEVRAMQEPCAAWRRHNYNMSKYDVDGLWTDIRRDMAAVELMNSFLARQGSADAAIVAGWPQHLRQRLTATKFRPDERMSHDDTVASLLRRYLHVIWQWPAYSTTKRIAATGWALMFAALPASLVRTTGADAARLTSFIYPLIGRSSPRIEHRRSP